MQRIDAIVADLLIEYRITAEWIDAIDVAECPDFPGFSAARGLASIAATKPTARTIGRHIARQQLKALKPANDIKLSEER